MKQTDDSEPLKDRQETFCKLRVPDTMTPTEAYRQAGFSPNNAKNNSSRLSAKECVKNRIAYLRAEAAVRDGINRDGQAKKLAIVQERCLIVGEHSTYVRAVEAQNRLYGLDKQVIETQTEQPMSRSEQQQADDWAEFRLWKASKGQGDAEPNVVGIRSR